MVKQMTENSQEISGDKDAGGVTSLAPDVQNSRLQNSIGNRP